MKYKTTVHQLIKVKELKRLRRADRALKVAKKYFEAIKQAAEYEADRIADAALERIKKDMARK